MGATLHHVWSNTTRRECALTGGPAGFMEDMSMRAEWRQVKHGEEYIGQHSGAVLRWAHPKPSEWLYWVIVPDEPAPGTWAWACEQMLAGKKVKRGTWVHQTHFYIQPESDDVHFVNDAGCEYQDIPIDRSEMSATDWQLYEERAKTWDEWFDAGRQQHGTYPFLLQKAFPPPSLIDRMAGYFQKHEHRAAASEFNGIKDDLTKWQESRK